MSDSSKLCAHTACGFIMPCCSVGGLCDVGPEVFREMNKVPKRNKGQAIFGQISMITTLLPVPTLHFKASHPLGIG